MRKEFWLMSLKNLRHRGLRTWLTLLGILIGVAAVVSLIGLGNGLQRAANAQFGVSSTEIISVQAGGITAGPPGSGVAEPLTINDLDALKDARNTEYAIRRNIVSLNLEYNDRVAFSYGTNIPDGDERDYLYEAIGINDVEKGRLLRDSDTNRVLLGHNFYSDSVGLGKPIKPGDIVNIKGKRFRVVGIIEKKGSFILDNIILMNEDKLEEISDYGDNVDIIAIKVKDRDKMDVAVEEIEEILREERNVEEGQENFKVSTPEAALSTVNNILLGIRIFVVVIALISVFVGSIGIVNTMTTSVVERRRDIGIMKSVGATNYHIFIQFFIEAGLLGMIGGIVGILLGTSISYFGIVLLNSFLGTELAPQIDYLVIALSLLGSFLIGALSGIWPAIRAAKQNPVEAIRS